MPEMVTKVNARGVGLEETAAEKRSEYLEEYNTLQFVGGGSALDLTTGIGPAKRPESVPFWTTGKGKDFHQVIYKGSSSSKTTKEITRSSSVTVGGGPTFKGKLFFVCNSNNHNFDTTTNDVYAVTKTVNKGDGSTFHFHLADDTGGDYFVGR